MNRREAGASWPASSPSTAPAATLWSSAFRGGVPVAYEVARALAAPLDVFPVRRLTLASTGDAESGEARPPDPRRPTLGSL